MKYLLVLLISCSSMESNRDYMIMTSSGTWVCENRGYDYFSDCEHVLYGLKKDIINNTSVLQVKEVSDFTK